jgi:hypothetical protein
MAEPFDRRCRVSLFRMTERAVVRPAPFATGTRAATASEASPGAGADPKNPAAEAIARIADYIPSEVVAIYIAGFGILQPTTSCGKWGIFALGALLVPIFVGGSLFAVGRDAAGRIRLSVGKRAGLVALGLISYAVWAAAIPQSAFVDLCPDANRDAAYAALVLSYLIPRAASLLGLDATQPAPAPP